MPAEATTSQIQISGPAHLIPLTKEERTSMTFRQLFDARLTVLKNGMKSPVRLEEIETFFGISATTLRAYCNGRSVPRDSLTELIEFSRRLGITCEELHCCWINTQNSIHGIDIPVS